MKVKFITIFLVSICSFGQSPEQYFKEGKMQFDSANYKDAIISYTNSYDLSVIKKNKKIESKSLASRGLAKSEIKDFKGAIEDYDKSLLIESNNPNVYFLKSICLVEISDYEKAIITITKALELDKVNGLYFLFRAGLKENINDFKGAIIDCLDVIKIDQKEGNAYAIMGRCKQKLGYSKFEVCLDFKNGIDLGDQECKEGFKKNCR
ncbi:MAG: tetratricopeptide repeat protein [Flavobacterium sp.]|jgi:tetratricopeptide (TPR) repeat protein|uniref:tetratricopeptide repeat protein n=1 Tax=Flavobacterium sp. TaxID=239 RepID=UPI003BC54AE9